MFKKKIKERQNRHRSRRLQKLFVFRRTWELKGILEAFAHCHTGCRRQLIFLYCVVHGSTGGGEKC